MVYQPSAFACGVPRGPVVMSYRDPRVQEWERRLKAVFDRIDGALERKYAGRYPLHPARPRQGETSSPEDDGLFDLGAAFSAGFGSEHGRGYSVQVRLATLHNVPDDVVQAIEEEVVTRLREELPRAFPGRDLTVVAEGHAFKIVGDLGLDTAP